MSTMLRIIGDTIFYVQSCVTDEFKQLYRRAFITCNVNLGLVYN